MNTLRTMCGALLVILLLAGCGSAAPAQPQAGTGKALVTVYKSPT